MPKKSAPSSDMVPVFFRVTAAEKEQMVAAAAACNKTLQDYLTRRALGRQAPMLLKMHCMNDLHDIGFRLREFHKAGNVSRDLIERTIIELLPALRALYESPASE